MKKAPSAQPVKLGVTIFLIFLVVIFVVGLINNGTPAQIVLPELLLNILLLFGYKNSIQKTSWRPWLKLLIFCILAVILNFFALGYLSLMFVPWNLQF